MVRTRSSASVKAGGKAPRKSSAQQGASSSADGQATSKKSNGSGNTVNPQPTPAWQKKVTDFLCEPPSKKTKGEVAISSDEDEGTVSSNGSAQGTAKNGSPNGVKDVPVESDVNESDAEVPAKLTTPCDDQSDAPDTNEEPASVGQMKNSEVDDKSVADAEYSANGSDEEVGEPEDAPDRGDGNNEEGAASDNSDDENGGGGAGDAGYEENRDHSSL